MKIPTALKHKPVITVNNYADADGRKRLVARSCAMQRLRQRRYLGKSPEVYGRKMVPPIRRTPAAPRSRSRAFNLPRKTIFFGSLSWSQNIGRRQFPHRPNRHTGKRNERGSLHGERSHENIRLFANALARVDEFCPNICTRLQICFWRGIRSRK